MGKCKPARRSLRFGGQFERRCRCLIHDQNLEYERLFKTSSKEFEKKKLQNLIDKKLISPKAKWICSKCLSIEIHEGLEVPVPDNEPDSSESSDDLNNTNDYDQNSLKEVCEALEKGVMNKTDLLMLSKAFGKCLRKSVNDDLSNISKTYKDITVLKDLDCKEFLKDRHTELTDFINNVCGIDISCVSSKKLLTYCLLIEQLYFLKKLNFIGPFSFSQNIVKWNLSGSKTCVAIDGGISASGSVTTLKKVLIDSSMAENKCFQSGDVDVFFDNTQRVGKTRRVREGGSTPMDIATIVVFIQSGRYSNVQEDPSLTPEIWKSRESGNPSQYHDACVQDFNKFKRSTQEDIINKVSSELVYDAESVEFKDHVSVKMLLHSMNIDKNVCVKCMKTYDKSSRYCPNCYHDPNFYNERNELYSDVPSCHFEQPAKVKMG